MQEKLNIAVFVDYDNIEIGLKSTLRRDFDVSLALDALKERGDLVAKFAYANWGRQDGATRQMAENAVQMVQRIPSPRGDKNGADINLALDALEMAFTHTHVNAFAIVSGDSDVTHRPAHPHVNPPVQALHLGLEGDEVSVRKHLLDALCTRQLADGAQLLDLRLRDHVIIGNGTERWVSLTQRGDL